MKKDRHTWTVMVVALLFGLAFGLLDGLLNYYFFRENLRFMLLERPNTLLESLLTNVSPYSLFVRTVFLIFALFGGALTAFYMRLQRQSERRYRTLFDHAPMGIGISTAAGNFIQCNGALERMTGYSKQELVKIDPAQLFADPQQYETLLHQLEEHGSVEDFRVKLRRKDGTPYDANLTFTPVVLGGREAYLSVLQDVTEQRRMEEALIAERASLAQRVAERTAELRAANVELEHAARLKDEFLANISHEVRTPLTLILTLSGMLRNGLYGDLTGKQEESLENIEESGHHLLNLISDILDLSKMGADRLKLNFGPVSVEELCRASLKFIEQEAHKKDLDVSLTIDDEVESIQGDERRLTQILVNLLSNAVKFTPAGGRIGLEVQGDSATRHIHFTVWDEGIGIAPEDMTRLFKPFVQLDSGPSREYEGTGLGLVLVQRLTRLHGGDVAVESEPGEGSAFTVTLPWTSEQAASFAVITPSAEELPPIETRTTPVVLVAEDNEDSLTALTDYLSARGFRVLQAENGKEALERARTAHPDAIVMDIQMPVMDGLEATRRIRTETSLEEVPIIALTALAMPGDEELCMAAGANAYFTKPVNLNELLSTIEAHINHGEAA